MSFKRLNGKSQIKDIAMRMSVKQKVGLVIGVVFVGVAVYMFYGAHQHMQRFKKWQEAVPIDIPVDFSKPGELSGTFTQTCDVSHGEVLYLKIPEEAITPVMNPELFSKLRFYCRIVDSQGKEIEVYDFSEDMSHIPRFDNGEIELLYFHPFGNGVYTLYLKVTEGLAELTDVPQRLMADYMLCGLELMPGRTAAWIGIACLIIASIIFIVIIVKSIVTVHRNKG